MPIGASKVGALGGLVPGGSVTFNAPGTWDVPPGVKVVSITGTGGTGNPGNAGNAGNPGNPGTGAPGGKGGGGIDAPGPLNYSHGAGLAFGAINQFRYQIPQGVAQGPLACSVRNAGPSSAPPGESGQSGNAGTAGNPGNPGNPGCASSALGNTFPGGEGGNAGAGGAAGNGGTGGLAGARGSNYCQGAGGGAGGTGGGNGGAGFANPGIMNQRNLVCGKSTPAQLPSPGPFTARYSGGAGGGGAGATNSGSSGANAFTTLCGVTPTPLHPWSIPKKGAGGTDNNISASTGNRNVPGILPGAGWPQSANTMGGPGSAYSIQLSCMCRGGSDAIHLVTTRWCNPTNPGCGQRALYPGRWCGGPSALINFSPVLPSNTNYYRAGGGGAMGEIINDNQPGNGMFNTTTTSRRTGGGGGGGGRGNAGNAAGPTPTPSGQAATPLTFNCVPVTPGTPTPITVGGPSGGQIVISWNPQ